MAKLTQKTLTYLLEGTDGEEFTINNNQLAKAIRILQSKCGGKSKIKKFGCMGSGIYVKRVKEEAALHCRQLPGVAAALRNAILKHDWQGVVHLAGLLCEPGIELYCTVLIRVCLLLLLNHPKSTYHSLENFIRSCTGYILEEDIRKFIKILLVTRSEPLPVLKVGTYIRSTTGYKVVDDLAFRDL